MNAITITGNGGELTITIKGDAYDTLQRMANAMNEWSVNGEDDRDNTPLTVFENFFTWELDLLEYPTEDTSSNVVDAIDTGTSDKVEERRRQDELTDLMRKHGLPTYKELYAKISKQATEKNIEQA